jgi:hypothetical protein
MIPAGQLNLGPAPAFALKGLLGFFVLPEITESSDSPLWKHALTPHFRWIPEGVVA